MAHIYDGLARLVFGKSWQKVQNSPFHYIQESDQNILIAGGGSGKLLSGLDDKKITYIELSSEMIKKAKSIQTTSIVNFIEADFLNWESNERFDVIIFPFFLDCFLESDLKKVLQKTTSMVGRNGKLIVTDFQKASPLKYWLVRLMYGFFRFTTGLKVNRLLDLRTQLKTVGFKEQELKDFYGGWIFCSEYKI